MKKLLSKIVIYGTVMASGYAMKKVVDFGYRKIKKEEPPTRIDTDRHGLSHILVYTLFSGSAAAVVRLLMKELVENKMDTKTAIHQ